jgi:cell wall-associated NlpC family hydrolase
MARLAPVPFLEAKDSIMLMRTAHLILTLICFGTMAMAQEGTDSETSTRKKTSATTATKSTSGTSSSAKKKPTSSGGTTSTSSSTASKPKPKPKSTGTFSESKATSSSKETAAKEGKGSREGEPKKVPNTEMTEKEKGTGTSTEVGGSEKKDSTSTASTKAKSKVEGEDSATTPSSKKATSSSSESAEEEGTDERDPTRAGKKAAAVSSIAPEELEGFEVYPDATQQLIRRSLELTTKNLRYQFGSSDPNAGGMDCSGTMYRVLQDSGIKDVPRQSDEICRWMMRRTQLYRTEDTSTLKDKSLSALKPGDLLFWTGTYDTSSPRELPISHVMLYLGKRKKDGKPIVFGASDGRSYDGQRRNGVSVFDFVMPKRDGKAAFYGYGPVPGLKGSVSASAGQ